MKLGVVGLGTMGLGIAQVFALAGVDVLATDIQPDVRARSVERMRAALAERVGKGVMPPEMLEPTMSRFQIVDDLAELAKAQMVIEAVVENLAVKQSVFASLERAVGPDVVLATNTSALSVAAMAQGLRRPHRVVGLHFFNPAPVMRLVELVAHSATSAEALTLARVVCEAADKNVITCPDRPGFIVNRCAVPYFGEALALLSEGRTAGEIDGAVLAAGYRIGPFSLIDLIGADVHLTTTEGIWRAMRHYSRYYPFDALREMAAAGRLGRKTGSGFVFPNAAGPVPADATDIVFRIEASLVNEAGWLLAEGGVAEDDVNLGLELGMNFPRGPFQMLARHGRENIQTLLASLEARAPGYLNGRYLPAPMLL